MGTEYFVQWADAPESGDPVFHGGDVVVTYLLTGETRAYNTRGGFFNAVSPAKSVFDGGPGAWEAVLRASYIDLDGGTLRGGKFWRITPMVELAPVRQPAPGARLRLRQARSLRPDRRHALLPEPHPVADLGATMGTIPSLPLRRALAALVVLTAAGGAHAAPPTGKPLMIVLPPESLPTGVGANGFVTAGTFYSGGGFHWMPTGGVVPIGGFDAVDVSRDGKVIVGSALDANRLKQAAIWTGGANWRLLGSVGAARPCDDLISSSFGTNDDGRVVVGLAWDGCNYARAFRWEESTGMVDLGTLSGGSTRANAVSGDGRVVVGWETHATGFRQAAKWVDRREELIRPGALLGEAHADQPRWRPSSSAAAAVPRSSAPPTAWTWTQAAGVTCKPVTFGRRGRWTCPTAR